jgi:hypothetical protein
MAPPPVFRLNALLFNQFTERCLSEIHAAVLGRPPLGGRNRFRLSRRFASGDEKHFVCALAQIAKNQCVAIGTVIEKSV